MAPNLTIGLDGHAYLSWIEPYENGHALRFSAWRQRDWTSPLTIAHGDNWFVNWADLPSIAALKDGMLAAHWLEKSGGETYAYDVRIALSNDGGLTWSDPASPHRDGTKTEHGFVTLVPMESGEFGVVWLDGRHTGEEPRGPMTLRYATLSRNGELGSEALVDDTVCDCCSTDAVIAGDGATIVAYRDRSSTEIRDISTSRLFRSTWSPPQTVHADNWEIGGCPVNGPALARESSTVVAAWFTMARNSPSVWVAFSDDQGRSFGRPIRVDDGNPTGRVEVVLLDDGAALVSWMEQESVDVAKIMVRRIGRSGTVDTIRVAATSPSRSSGFPRMVRLDDQILLAWTEPGESSRIMTYAVSISTAIPTSGP